MKEIVIIGAKENNLKDIDLTIPRNKIVCFVGVSGSGKSTIAFDIIAKEGQRQYFESLSSLARRYLQKSNKPLVDDIKGISSTVIISQARIHTSPRSTVGTLTETYTYLRLLYSRVGYPIYDSSYFSFNHPSGACPKCKGIGTEYTFNLDTVVDFSKSLQEGAIKHANYKPGKRLYNILSSSRRLDMNKKIKDYSQKELHFLLYTDRVELSNKDQGFIQRFSHEGIINRLKRRAGDLRGMSERKKMTDKPFLVPQACTQCHGWRIKEESLKVKINGLNIGEVANLPISKALEFVQAIDHRNASVIRPRLLEQLRFLNEAGVGYLSLNRSTDTLSGGEAQRVKLARQLGCDLVETIYVLDEPTAGLHPKDLRLVIRNLEKLRNSGNTVLIVEHDETIIRASDYIVEVGPGGGKKGGEIVFTGTREEFSKSETSLTARYLYNPQQAALKSKKREPTGTLKIEHAKRNNLKDIHVDIPIGMLVALTGVSGAGKSSLVEEMIDQHPDKVVSIGQQAIGTNKRGCIATYVGIFDHIRKLFARRNEVSPSLFSFNSHLGSCQECRGLGFIQMDMNFLGNVKMRCEKCNGKRYTRNVLEYKVYQRNIADILRMTTSEANEFFKEKGIKEGLRFLLEVGLDYIELGQTLDTLSGGEAQRLKLASRLTNKGEVYVLDEPTSGLHYADVEKLMKLLNTLVDHDNTVIVIEHNLQVISQANWIIDLGPEGGDKGGFIIAQGTPGQVMKYQQSSTGRYLKKYVNAKLNGK